MNLRSAASLAPATLLPPGPRAPRAVQTLAWMTRPFPFMERSRARYGDTFTVRVAHEGTWVFLAGPDAVKQVFTGDAETFHAGEANAVLGPVLGSHSVLLLDERPHLAQRKLMLPAFHGERMQRYGELMARAARTEIDRWPGNTPMPVVPRMQALTLEVIMGAVFGVTDPARLDALRRRLRTLLRWSTDPRTWVAFAVLGPGRVGSVAAFRRVLDAVDEVIYDELRRRRRDPQLHEREDILSMLLGARHEDDSPMSDVELRDELMTLLVAGHETTATALSWAIERLVRHPDKLERLRQEIASGQEEYLDAVIKETLRLRPVLPIVVRKLTRPVTVGGYDLPAGVTVAPCIYLVHRRPDVYPDPTAFRPERFLESAPGTYTWIPFGGGVRRCLGASFALFEMKTVLGEVVSNLALEPAQRASEPVRRRAITLVPGRGGEVVVSRTRTPERNGNAPGAGAQERSGRPASEQLPA